MVPTGERTFVSTMTSAADPNLTSGLREALDDLDRRAGTIHLADEGELTLAAHEGMPEEVLDRVETVPVDKGMAGIAAECREPVQSCSLQTDAQMSPGMVPESPAWKGRSRRRCWGPTGR